MEKANQISCKSDLVDISKLPFSGRRRTYFNFPTQFDTTGLERAFQWIEPRDRYIFFAHVLDERTFTELAAELGIGYKGVAAAYYRTIHKIRNVLQGDAHGF